MSTSSVQFATLKQLYLGSNKKALDKKDINRKNLKIYCPFLVKPCESDM